jgi:hypothetical protein
MLIFKNLLFTTHLHFSKKPFFQKENPFSLFEVNVFKICMWIMLAAYSFIPECKGNMNNHTNVAAFPRTSETTLAK